jgi:hypothetical protein
MEGDEMRGDGMFRFLSIATALVLWMGAVATAEETSDSEKGQTPAAESAPPAAPDGAADEDGGGEAPEEGSEEESKD